MVCAVCLYIFLYSDSNFSVGVNLLGENRGTICYQSTELNIRCNEIMKRERNGYTANINYATMSRKSATKLIENVKEDNHMDPSTANDMDTNNKYADFSNCENVSMIVNLIILSDTKCKNWPLHCINNDACACVTSSRYLVKSHINLLRQSDAYICVSKQTIIGSYNGLSPGRRQAIIWTNAGILLIGPLGTNFREILIGIQTFSFKKIHLKMSSAKWRPFCLGLNVLKPGSGNEFGTCTCNVVAMVYVATNRSKDLIAAAPLSHRRPIF